jgi:DNA mismatch repair ATPase MutS
VVIEETIRHGDIGLFLSLHSRLVGPYIGILGGEALKQRLIPRMISGETILGVAMSEPGAGSDISGTRTHASRDGADWIISGSNMAGKSTLLRSIGTNAVLALAGAPVRAARLSLTPFQLCASISTADSLLEGKSRFMAEVERIRDTLQASASAPVLFLIDEIFSGTNSHDRRIAAECVIRALIKSGAVGAISTHDLALTEIAPLAGMMGDNVHMCSRSDEDALDFDYLVKPGVNRQSNALAIVRLAGVPL